MVPLKGLIGTNNMYLSIGAAALAVGVSVVTLRRWAKSGRLMPSHRTLGGHRRYDEDELALTFHKTSPSHNGHAVAYARVSARDQQKDLGIQQQKLDMYCSEHFSSYEVISDLGSGLNYKKPGLLRLLKMIHQRSFSHLVINHKDRLLRFGSEIIFSLCKAQGIAVSILEDNPAKSFELELSNDVIELMTVFPQSSTVGARIAIKRRYRHDRRHLDIDVPGPA